MRHVLNDVGNVAIWASAVFIVIFTIQYSVLSPWWRHFIGITIIGEGMAILAIYIPTLMVLAGAGPYTGTAWYLWLTVVIVVATAFFMGTRIVVWESIRRKRRSISDTQLLLPSKMAARIAELEAEVARLREGA